MLSATLPAPLLLRFFAQEPAKLRFWRVGPFADRSDTEMAPKREKKKATRLTKTPRIIERSVEMETKLTRLGELKGKFAGVVKALRPALAELAGRTSRQLDRPAYHRERDHKAQYDALIEELEKVRDFNIGLRVAYHETRQELKAVSVQHETFQEMMTIEKRFRVIDLS